jgi:adenine-specific DNA methylase
MIFTYHHSRPNGWQALLTALHAGDFQIVAVYPIKSEMSVGRPKLQAKSPIDIDIIIVSRKRTKVAPLERGGGGLLPAAQKRTTEAITRMNATGRRLSMNDVLVILMANLLRPLSHVPPEKAQVFLQENQSAIAVLQEECWASQELSTKKERTLFDLMS